MSTSLVHSGLPEGMTRYDLARLVEQTRRPLQLSKTAISVLVHYITRCTFDQDYEPGRVCAAWPRVSTIADRLGLSERSINNAERELEFNRLLKRTTGGNGARFGERTTEDCPKISWAAGVNLGPLIERIGELRAALRWIEKEQRVLNSLRAEIKLTLRRIREISDGKAAVEIAEILPGGRTSRLKDVAKLE